MSSNNSSNSTTHQTDALLDNLSIATDVFSFYCVSLHLVYFVLVVFIKELRTRPLFFINHSVATNTIAPLAILTFQYFDPATVDNQTTVSIVCSIFEIYWSFSYYIRTYSILLIAVHRYMAVFKLEMFKKINSSNVYLIGLVVFVWVISFAFSFIFKYMFSTTYSLTFCFNGFSTVFLHALLYDIFFVLFAIILPAIAIVVIYILISVRLQKSGKRVHREQPSDSNHRVREMRFANQFIVMCTLVILSSFGFILTGLKSVIPDYFSIFYYWRPVFRIYIVFFSSLIPLLVLFFNPFGKRVIGYLKFC